MNIIFLPTFQVIWAILKLCVLEVLHIKISATKFVGLENGVDPCQYLFNQRV